MIVLKTQERENQPAAQQKQPIFSINQQIDLNNNVGDAMATCQLCWKQIKSSLPSDQIVTFTVYRSLLHIQLHHVFSCRVLSGHLRQQRLLKHIYQIIKHPCGHSPANLLPSHSSFESRNCPLVKYAKRRHGLSRGIIKKEVILS